MSVLEYLLSIIYLIPTVMGNWCLLYRHQVELVWEHLSSDPVTRDRALQCLLPPTLTVLITLALASFVINRPTAVLWPLKMILPAIPWAIPAVAFTVFAIVARPALWEHRCEVTPIRINPSDRGQWRVVWTSLNAQRHNEKNSDYDARMEDELDEWALRERDVGDLEDWIKITTQAHAKTDCLFQKDKVFRETFLIKLEEWKRMADMWWRENRGREWLIQRSMFDSEVCRPETKKSMWETMLKRAKGLGFGR